MKYIVFFVCLVSSNAYASSFFDASEIGTDRINDNITSCLDHFSATDEFKHIGIVQRQLYCFCMTDSIRWHEKQGERESDYFNNDSLSCQRYSKANENNIPYAYKSLYDSTVLSSQSYYSIFFDCWRRTGKSNKPTCVCATDYFGFISKSKSSEKIQELYTDSEYQNSFNANVARCRGVR